MTRPHAAEEQGEDNRQYYGKILKRREGGWRKRQVMDAITK